MRVPSLMGMSSTLRESGFLSSDGLHREQLLDSWDAGRTKSASRSGLKIKLAKAAPGQRLHANMDGVASSSGFTTTTDPPPPPTARSSPPQPNLISPNQS